MKSGLTVSKKRKAVAKFGKPNKKVNSETKNISKNYGKQVIKFIKKERKLVRRVLKSIGSPHKVEQINIELRGKKNDLNRIEDLRSLWLEGPFCK